MTTEGLRAGPSEVICAARVGSNSAGKDLEVPAGLRTVVEIQELRGLLAQASAEAPGISVSATKGRLFRGKIVLRKYLMVKSLRFIAASPRPI